MSSPPLESSTHEEAARWAQCTNNMKRIGLAFHDYESSDGCIISGSMSAPGVGTLDPETGDRRPGWGG